MGALTAGSLQLHSQGGQPQAAAPQGRGGGRGAPPGLEPRILAFEVKPTTVRAGEPVVIVWRTENPAGGLAIEPDLGAVAARGTRQLTPTKTTTYTLTMRGGPTRTVTVTVQGTAPAVAASPAPGGSSGIPRMPDGKPDLTGVYGNAGLPPGTSPPPLKSGAEKFRIVRGDNDVKGRTTITTGLDCNPLGIPQTYITPYPFQIVQLPKFLLFLYEYPNALRFVPTDGRPHEADPDPTWMGSSVAKWDGDTLVIDAIGFNDKTEVHGFMHTEALHVVEKFRRLENGNLQYEVTVEDPNVWQTPWVIAPRVFQRRPEVEFISEFVCEARTDYQRLFKKE